MTIEDRLNKLERSCHRNRWISISLAALMLLIAGLGATQDKTVSHLVLDKLIIQDDRGRKRIVFGTDTDGSTSMEFMDMNGRRRIAVGTLANGQANVRHFDSYGKPRISAGTLRSGSAPTLYIDANGKVRMIMETTPNDEAISRHIAATGKAMITVSTPSNANPSITVVDRQGKEIGSLP